MKQILLTQGKVTLVDDADFESVSRFKWFVKRTARRLYAARLIPKASGGRKLLLMHRFLMPGIPILDHVNGDGLDNRRINLRAATAQQNTWSFNRPRTGVSSKFRGVGWHKKSQRWQAYITKDRRMRHLGRFDSEMEAAKAYDAAAKKLFGGFACPNFS